MPNKPDKYGMKCWMLADAKNFYPLNIEVYTGKNLLLSNKSEEITMRMVSKLSPDHIVVGDTYFTSLNLSNRLMKERKLLYLGTINHRRREIPNCLSIAKGLPLHSSSISLLTLP